MTIYLVRHGETAHNRDGQGLGRFDADLTEVGLAQAEAVADRLATEPVKRVLSSPLERANHVARLIASHHNLSVETRPELTELDVGDTEGLAFAESRLRFPEFMKAWASDDNVDVRMPGGESMADLARRLEPLVAELRAEQEGDIVVVSHNFALRAFICLFLGVELSYWRAFTLDLASVTALAARNERVAVRFVNDTCHLSHLNLA